MESWSAERRLHLLFVSSVLLKALNGVVELVLGGALVFNATALRLMQAAVRNELIEDPTDFFATSLRHFAYPILAQRQSFASIYLLSHGAIKLLLAAGLLRNRLWAYPAAIIVFILFIIYQAYRISFTHSSLLTAITGFDLLVIALTWHEYRVIKSKVECDRRRTAIG
ncbi:MAG: DUF2127 domain-containing protein [Candidatus Binataceae bacterium]